MTGFSPQFLLSRLIVAPTDGCVRQAEADLRSALARSFPELDTSRWRPAVLGESALPSSTSRATWRGMEFGIAYTGLAYTKLGVTASAAIRYEQATLLSTPSIEIDCLTGLIRGSDTRSALLGIGQNPQDLSRGGVHLGAKADIALRLLARRAGLTILADSPISQCIVSDLRDLLRQSLGDPERTAVYEDQVPSFLKQCFEEVAAHTSVAAFDARFSAIGITWYVSSWPNRLLGRTWPSRSQA